MELNNPPQATRPLLNLVCSLNNNISVQFFLEFMLFTLHKLDHL